jgi:NodT family efflux transporter outer membrane factor (OMF) lipoprotein
MIMKRIGLRNAALPILLLYGCSFAPKQTEPVTVAAVPVTYESAPDSGSYQPDHWWRVFNDPVMERLVDTALAANLDLREAVARVEEVRQRYRIARADLMPTLDVSGDVAYSDQPANVGIGGEFGAGGASRRFDFTTYGASVGFAYEIDFWGRASNDTKAAVSDFLATEEDYRTARLAVVSATIATYLEIVDLRRQVALTTLNVELLQERTELTDRRYYRGLVSSFELYTFRSFYRNTQASLPLIESRLADARGRLSVLLGRYSSSLDDILTDDYVPAIVLDPVPPDLPAALLEQRPDVMASWRRMEAARFRIGARKAQLYPAIRLNARVGLQSSTIDNLFRVDQYFLNLLGGLFQPIFQGGRLRANVSASEAVFQQRASAYVRSVLTAYSEVESSLENLENQKERYDFLLRQQLSARGSVDYQLRSLQRGVGSYIEYLDARTNLVAVETNLASAERTLSEGRLAVHRALGGSWVSDVDLGQELQLQYQRFEQDLVPTDDNDNPIDEVRNVGSGTDQGGEAGQ